MSSSFEIRECQICGLRYPLVEGNLFGIRCPACLGDTKAVLVRPIINEVESLHHPPHIVFEALLDNIRSAWNVGSIFRTADGLGMTHLHLCGITPTPEIDSVGKTSLGADASIKWTYHKNALHAAKELKSKGYKVFALEEDKRATPIQDTERIAENDKLVLVAGSEVTGIDPELLDQCDHILFIPMHGKKKSFNVAVAFSIAAFTLSFQNR